MYIIHMWRKPDLQGLNVPDDLRFATLPIMEIGVVGLVSVPMA